MRDFISTTLHIYSSLVPTRDYFLGCLWWYQGNPVLSRKAPKEVVTSGHEGAIYVKCVREDHI
jgi:hypothetical protein